MNPIDFDSCATIFRMLDDYLDRELTERDLARVERHLVSCALCALEFRLEGRVMRELRAKMQRIAAPPHLHARVWKGLVSRARPGNFPPAPLIDQGDGGKDG